VRTIRPEVTGRSPGLTEDADNRASGPPQGEPTDIELTTPSKITDISDVHTAVLRSSRYLDSIFLFAAGARSGTADDAAGFESPDHNRGSTALAGRTDRSNRLNLAQPPPGRRSELYRVAKVGRVPAYSLGQRDQNPP